jgi:putative ABC transport system permease protein
MPGSFRDWQREARSFEWIAAFTYVSGAAALTGATDPEQLQIRYVSSDYFRVFGMAPLVGRTLDASDVGVSPGSIVISEGLWRRRFGADSATVGRDVRLGDQPVTVVGIMPHAFETAGGRVDAWAVLYLPPEEPGQRLRAHYLGVIARLRSDVSVAQAIDDVKAIAARAEKTYPDANAGLSATVKSISGERGGTLRAGLTLLAGAAAAVLLIACANVAGLQLARGISREREFAIRAALGAGRGRIARQLVTENVLLSVLGAIAGLMLGSWLLQTIGAIGPETVRIAAGDGLDRVIIGYAVALAISAAFVFSAAPAWRASSRATMRLGPGAARGDRRTTTARTLLVGVQIAVAMILLISVALLGSSLLRVLRVDPGFDPSVVLAFDVSTPASRYNTLESRNQLFARIAEEVKALPGVTAACATNRVPFDDVPDATMTYVPDGQTYAERIVSSPRTVTPECFDVLRLRVVRGRRFTANETARLGIVTEGFAASAWPGQDPIGKRVHQGVPTGPLIEVIGVVNDSLQSTLEGQPTPQLYEMVSAPTGFLPSRMLVRTAAQPASLFGALRAAVRRVDPTQPVARLRSLEEVIAASMSSRRFELSLISSFSTIALVLVAVGIYGLLAQIVDQRATEIGIRLALGATRASTVRMVMKATILPIAVGIPTGLVGALVASRLLRRFVFGVSATEPQVYALVAAALAVFAICAGWLAAGRAGRIAPMTVLRE